jgi:hypothetical protein
MELHSAANDDGESWACLIGQSAAAQDGAVGHLGVRAPRHTFVLHEHQASDQQSHVP